MNIKQLREEYPEYNDIPDARLAELVRAKFMPEMGQEEFNKSFGVEVPEGGFVASVDSQAAAMRKHLEAFGTKKEEGHATTKVALQDTDGGKALTDAAFVTAIGGLAGVLLFWLLARHLRKKAHASPHQLGVWWGAWVASIWLANVIAVQLNKNFPFSRSTDWADFGLIFVFAIAPLTIFVFIIAYGAGRFYRRLKPLTGAMPPPPPTGVAQNSGHAIVEKNPAPQAVIPDEAYAEAMAEVDEDREVKGIWARCYAQAGGDESKTKSSYIALRASELAPKYFKKTIR